MDNFGEECSLDLFQGTTYKATEKCWDGQDWRMPEFYSHRIKFNVTEVYLKCTEQITLNIDQIAWKGKHLSGPCRCCNGKATEECDISFPPIVTKASNPYSLTYRCIDGKHRLMKMRDLGHETVLCNFITTEKLKEVMQPHARFSLSSDEIDELKKIYETSEKLKDAMQPNARFGFTPEEVEQLNEITDITRYAEHTSRLLYLVEHCKPHRLKFELPADVIKKLRHALPESKLKDKFEIFNIEPNKNYDFTLDTIKMTYELLSDGDLRKKFEKFLK